MVVRNLQFSILLAFTLIASNAVAADYFVAPSGSDSNPGTLAAPFASLSKAYSLATAGTNIYLRAGTYFPTSQYLLNKSGANGNPIRIAAYNGEPAVIDGIKMTQEWEQGAAIRILGSYHHLLGLEIKNAANYGIFIESGTNNVLERLNVHHSGRTSEWEGSGIVVSGTASNTLVVNCDSHHNRDLRMDNADGFYNGSRGSGNVFRGTRAWKNSDDGYDAYYGTPATYENAWAFENGYDDSFRRLGDGNGFKLGGSSTSGGHLVKNCLSWRNPMHGFDQNGATLGTKLYNNTAWSNGPAMPGGVSWARDFYFFSQPNVFRNNVAFGTGNADSGDSKYNSWNLPVSVSAADFISMNDSIAKGPRQSDGSLPNSGFLRLAAGSELIDKGVNVGLPHNGSAPDLGAYEYLSVSPTPTPSPTATPRPTATPSPTPSPTATPRPTATPGIIPMPIIDPGFENGGSAWENYGNTRIVSANFASGAYSLRAGYGVGGRGQVIRNINPNASFTLSASAKIEAVSEQCYVGITFLDSNGVKIAGAESTMRVASSSWSVHKVDTKAPASASSARIWFWNETGSAKCWADDFKLVTR